MIVFSNTTRNGNRRRIIVMSSYIASSTYTLALSVRPSFPFRMRVKQKI